MTNYKKKLIYVIIYGNDENISERLHNVFLDKSNISAQISAVYN